MARTKGALNKPKGEEIELGANPVKVSGEHRASFSWDKMAAAWRIFVVGPRANMFAGRTIPVRTKNGDNAEETLSELVHTGVLEQGDDAGSNFAIYTFIQKPMNDDIPF